MFVVRGTIQEFLGFSPAELVFGHLVHGPFKFLSEQFLAKEFPSYVRARLCEYCMGAST